ncbi:hypothetical protein BC940DRAFT_120569 [Gongronella butleri]|nr:hypothetical protein BC940DRAFT_120569 [Gongronella butleri]
MNLTRQRLQELRQAFREVDEQQVELLDERGLAEVLAMLGYARVSAAAMMQRVHREKDGFVTFDDLKDIVLALESEATDSDDLDEEKNEEMTRTFQLLADPEHGCITLDQLIKAVNSQGHDWTRQQLKEMMDVADRDHDGLLTLDDFRVLWARVMQ